MRTKALFFSTLLLFLLSPVVLFAEGLVTCHEAGSCSFCRLLEMIDGIVGWLIVIVTLFTMLILAYAGVLLIFSRGDASALQKGKQIFFQAIIGILIMLAGWTIVDTVFKVLVGGEFGMWNEVTCGAGEFQVGEAEYAITLHEYEIGVEEGAVLDVEGSEMSSCDTSQIVSTRVFGHTIQIHQSLVSSLQRIDSAWRAHGSDYAVHSVGGYACRNVAGSSRRSYHSYGVAIDVNPSANPHRFDGVCTTDMPDWFVSIWKREGWGWGCDWSSSKDAMHFSKASGEGGNLNVKR